MPCPSHLHISKLLTKKVSIIYYLAVDKESEIKRGQMTSLTKESDGVADVKSLRPRHKF